MGYDSQSVLRIDQYSVESTPEHFFVVGQIMSTELIEEAILKRDIPKLLGKEVRLEHVAPEIEPHSMVGEVVGVWWDEKVNQPFAKAEIYGDTEEEIQLRKDLIEDQKKELSERKYKGFSIGIIRQRDSKTKETQRIFPRELSITTDPVCTKCIVDTVEVYSLSVKDNAELIHSAYSEQIKLLTEKNENLKQEMDKSIKEYSAAQQILTSKLAEKDKTIESYKKQLSDIEVENAKTLKEKDDSIAKLTEQFRRSEIEPIVEALLKTSYSKDSEAYKKKKDLWMTFSKETLVEMADLKRRDIGVYTQVLPAEGVSTEIPVERSSPDGGVGEIKMDGNLARKVL